MENGMTLQRATVAIIFSAYMGIIAGIYGMEILSWNYLLFIALPSVITGYAVQFAKVKITPGQWKMRNGVIARVFRIDTNNSIYPVYGEIWENGKPRHSDCWTAYGQYFNGREYKHGNDLIRKVK